MSRARPRPDPLHKGTLTFRQHSIGVELAVLEGVFAAAGVDAGTKQLLRRLAEERFAGASRVLDVGCGYGPLALWLAAAGAGAGRRVLGVDRDARAVAATGLGAAANRLDSVTAAGALGYDEIGDEPFDLIVSNIPAKVGPAALDHLVLDAAHHLGPTGLVAIVVVDRLAAEVAGRLTDPAIEVLATHPTKTYTVFVYRFDEVPAAASTAGGFARGAYRRGRQTFTAGQGRWDAEVSFSIGEFDELGHGTRAALEVLPRSPGTAVVDGPGQGHVPLALRAGGFDGPLALVDRDLLALRTTDANLGGGSDSRHRPRLLAEDVAGAGLVVCALPEREPVAVTAAVLGEALGSLEGSVLLHGRHTDVQRVLELLRRHGRRLAVERTATVHGHRATLATPR